MNEHKEVKVEEVFVILKDTDGNYHQGDLKEIDRFIQTATFIIYIQLRDLNMTMLNTIGIKFSCYDTDADIFDNMMQFFSELIEHKPSLDDYIFYIELKKNEKKANFDLHKQYH